MANKSETEVKLEVVVIYICYKKYIDDIQDYNQRVANIVRLIVCPAYLFQISNSNRVHLYKVLTKREGYTIL